MRLSMCVAGVLMSVAPALAGGSDVSGNWSGEMRQIDPAVETRYPMILRLDGETGASLYPTLNCGGAWARIGETKDGYTIYKETVVNEQGAHCIDGYAIVHPDDGKLVLGWFAAFEGAPSLASAVLEKGAK
jgi:hypothetical protein